MMKELPDEIYTKIEKWSEEGNNFFEQEQFTQALGKYEAALQLVPEPKLDWEASTWLYTSIGDVHFSEEIFDKAKDSYYNALNCPDGIHNPYINLSLGQTLYEHPNRLHLHPFTRRSGLLQEKIADNWQETLIYNIADTDFCRFLFSGKEIWVCSEKAKQLIEPLLQGNVEFLPLLPRSKAHKKIPRLNQIFQRKAYKPIIQMIPESPYYMLNITNIEPSEVIDNEQSDIGIDANGVIYMVEQLAFHPQKIQNIHLFKIDNGGTYFKSATFISDQLKNIIETNYLTGITFIKRPQHEGGTLIWEG